MPKMLRNVAEFAKSVGAGSESEVKETHRSPGQHRIPQHQQRDQPQEQQQPGSQVGQLELSCVSVSSVPVNAE